MHISLSTIRADVESERNFQFCASHTYKLAEGQEAVHLVFAKTSVGFNLFQGQTTNSSDNARSCSLGGPFR